MLTGGSHSLSPSPTSTSTSTSNGTIPHAEPTAATPTAAPILLTVTMTLVVVSGRVRLPRPPTLLPILIGLRGPGRQTRRRTGGQRRVVCVSLLSQGREATPPLAADIDLPILLLLSLDGRADETLLVVIVVILEDYVRTRHDALGEVRPAVGVVGVGVSARGRVPRNGFLG
jgi:hypothetical protein